MRVMCYLNKSYTSKLRSMRLLTESKNLKTEGGLQTAMRYVGRLISFSVNLQIERKFKDSLCGVGCFLK